MQVFARTLTEKAATTGFFIFHAVAFSIWIVWNLGIGGLPQFDPFPYGLLTMIVSLEAIFLSLFVLMTQSRESTIAELREEMTLQVNLRIEEEVTKTLQLVAGRKSVKIRSCARCFSRSTRDASSESSWSRSRTRFHGCAQRSIPNTTSDRVASLGVVLRA